MTLSNRTTRERLDRSPRVAAVVVAGGSGERFGAPGGKQLAEVEGVPVLGHALGAFLRASSVSEIVVVVHPERVEEYRARAVAPLGDSVPVMVVAGGDTRLQSVANGLAAVSRDADVIAVHDGARPLVMPATIDEAVAALIERQVDGVVVGHPSYDTVKLVDGVRVTGTADRTRFWVAQTPQVFDARVLRTAYERALAEGYSGTDDASLVERIDGVVEMLEGPRENIKVTVAEDLDFVAAVLRHRKEA